MPPYSGASSNLPVVSGDPELGRAGEIGLEMDGNNEVELDRSGGRRGGVEGKLLLDSVSTPWKRSIAVSTGVVGLAGRSGAEVVNGIFFLGTNGASGRINRCCSSLHLAIVEVVAGARGSGGGEGQGRERGAGSSSRGRLVLLVICSTSISPGSLLR